MDNMTGSDRDYRESIVNAIHLSIQIVDEHFGKIENIRKVYSDREEVEFQKNLKMRTYEIILKELLKQNSKLKTK
jgi:hypothetical protein